MGKASVVGSGNGLEEEVRETTCRPCLALISTASELVGAGSLALVEECLGLSAQCTTVFNSKGENPVRSNITVHLMLAALRCVCSASYEREGGGTSDVKNRGANDVNQHMRLIGGTMK